LGLPAPARALELERAPARAGEALALAPGASEASAGPQAPEWAPGPALEVPRAPAANRAARR